MATNVLGTVYETLLCSPGMSEAVKVDVKVSRKAVLLLSSLIEQGLEKQEKGNELLSFVPSADKEELKQFAEECLKRAGLSELSQKIKGLTGNS